MDGIKKLMTMLDPIYNYNYPVEKNPNFDYCYDCLKMNPSGKICQACDRFICDECVENYCEAEKDPIWIKIRWHQHIFVDIGTYFKNQDNVKPNY